MDYPVRGASAELGRADIADLCIGKMLANASVGKDGIWPCEPVREVMEEIPYVSSKLLG
jgi:hypothetical protein